MASAPAAGFAKSMSESRAEALQALLDSLAPGAEANRGDKLPPDQVRRISDRLGELLGEDAMPDMPQRNEKGELVNEEGLPIIDIVEPVSATEAPSAPVAFASGSHGPDLIPLWALSPVERARRRAEQDRILDALEEEERVQQQKDEEHERESFKADLEKRKQAAEAEMDALKKAREMQKKMGKALLRNLAAAREQEQQEKLALEEADKQAREERKKLKPRKSVTFADLPPDHEYQPANSVPMPPPFDWGDVAPAMIQRGEKPSLITKTQMDQGPMRMNVVERVPGRILRGPKSPPPPTQKDSDDESEPDSAAPADSDEDEVIVSDHSDSENPPSDDESDESDYGVPEDNEPIEWDDESYDYARHQREVALEYYEKRATVGAEALAAMRNHEHTEEESEWDQPNVPLEASLASSPPKPTVSRFRASRTSSSSLPSKSLGGSILPASQSSALKGAVRLGKLENENLVGGDDGESEDEIDPAAKDMLERIKRGEVMNVGPSVSSGTTNGPAETTAPAIDGTPSIVTPPATSTASTPPKPSRVSKFKMSLADPSSLQVPSSPGSSLTTPITATERSSPKLASGEGTPISVPTKNSTMAGPSAAGREKRRPQQMPGMIVDSPSFPALGVDASSSLSISADAATTSSPAFHSMVIESPSFHSPSSTLVGTPTSAAPSPNILSPETPSRTTAPLSASVLERKPIVASEVRESGAATSRSVSSTPVEKKKMSRFLAERG